VLNVVHNLLHKLPTNQKYNVNDDKLINYQMKSYLKSKEVSPTIDTKPRHMKRHKRSLSDVFMTSKDIFIKQEKTYNLFS